MRMLTKNRNFAAFSDNLKAEITTTRQTGTQNLDTRHFYNSTLLGLFLHKRLLKCLGNIDYEVSHLLQLADNVHIVDAGVVVLTVALEFLDLCLTEVVAEVIDAVLGIVCVGYLLQRALMRSLKVREHCLVSMIYGSDHSLDLLDSLLVEDLLVDVSSCKDAADGLA